MAMKRRRLGGVVAGIRPKAMLKAIIGTAGILNVIADRLQVERWEVRLALRREGQAWDYVRKVYEEECERVGDLAEGTIREAIEQRLDIPSAVRAATWYLQHKHKDRGFGEKTEVTLQGGKQPIRVNHTSAETVLTVDDLDDLPLDLRKQLLEALTPPSPTPEEDEE